MNFRLRPEPNTVGPAGTAGSVWREGTGAPAAGLGVNGDFYLDDATGDVYQKAAGVYSIVANIKGPIGNTGATGAAGAGYTATSTTSLLIGTGSKAFTTQAGLAYTVGARARASSAANGANYMEGLITAYTGTTLTVNVDRVGGSGTFADWNINLAGDVGGATGVYNVKDYGAVGDAKGASGSAITSGTAALTNAANPWVSGDVGKRISVAGAGAAGATLETTISAFVGAGSLTLAAAAGTTVASANTHWGTDDTAAVQAAINAATGKGQVYLPNGNYFTSALNLTGKVGIHIQGTGYYGSQLWPWASGINFLDCTGSQQVVMKDFTIGAGAAQSSVPNTAVLLALNSALAGIDFEATGVYIIGRWAKAAVYDYGFAGAIWHVSHIYNYLVASGARALFITDTNDDALTSAFATIATGTRAPNYQQFVDTDIEEWINNGTTVTNGVAISFKGVADAHFVRCQVVGQKGDRYVSLAGTCSGLAWERCTFEPGGSTVPTYVFVFVSSPSITDFALPGNDINFGTALLNGAVTKFDPGTGGTQLNFNSDPKNAIAAGATRYIGGNGDGVADIQVCKYLPVRGVLTQMFVGANNPPGAAQSYTVVAWIQDGTKPQTITAAISGATASTAQDIVNYVEVAKFDRVSLRLVTSAGATTVYLGGTLAFLPY